MRYKNKKTGCIANVREDKPMNTDWVPAEKPKADEDTSDQTNADEKPDTGNADPGKSDGKPSTSWKNDAIDEYAEKLGIDTKAMKKEEKLSAIAAKEAEPKEG